MNTELDLLLNDYLELSKKEDEIKANKDALKAKIIESMGTENKYENDTLSATVTDSTGFKYLDETAVIKVLKDNGYAGYVKEKVDTSLNKILKTETPLTESLKGLVEKTITTKLSVKQK